MYTDELSSELARLNFEDLIWITYASISLANVVGNYYSKEHLKTNDPSSLDKANDIFETTLIINFLIYIYFFLRNYKQYEEASPEDKETYLVRLLGSGLLIAGIICLIYFQTVQSGTSLPSAR